jgi:hypothetical protein
MLFGQFRDWQTARVADRKRIWSECDSLGLTGVSARLAVGFYSGQELTHVLAWTRKVHRAQSQWSQRWRVPSPDDARDDPAERFRAMLIVGGISLVVLWLLLWLFGSHLDILPPGA